MALTASEEALIRQLLAEQAAILSLAGNEATITSKLGATKVTLSDLVAASAVNDTDLLLARQGTVEKSMTPALMRTYLALGFAPLTGAVFTGAISATNLSGTNTGDEPTASTTVEGVIELATATETKAGTMTSRAVTPYGNNQALKEWLPAGFIADFSGTAAPTGWLACPLVQTDISRTAYPDLFAAIGTTWGVGDTTTTFGMPWFPADYVASQANANVGSSTTGVVKNHVHPYQGRTDGIEYAGATGARAGEGTESLVRDTSNNTGGGAANLAAGVRLMKCVKI